jgi:hypothetical protein
VTVESGTVARTIPGLFDIVPAYDAAQVWAYGRVFMADTLFITVHRRLAQTSTDYGSRPSCNFIERINLATRQPVPKLADNIEVFGPPN